jgi:predicted Fe-S protein YdhL (DUF1289 family)
VHVGRVVSGTFQRGTRAREGVGRGRDESPCLMGLCEDHCEGCRRVLNSTVGWGLMGRKASSLRTVTRATPSAPVLDRDSHFACQKPVQFCAFYCSLAREDGPAVT